MKRGSIPISKIIKFIVTTLIIRAVHATYIDLTESIVLFSSSINVQTAHFLVNEVQKRSHIQWRSFHEDHEIPHESEVVISLSLSHGKSNFCNRSYPLEHLEEFDIYIDRPKKKIGNNISSIVCIVGNDRRGVVFGVGRFLREMESYFKQEYGKPGEFVVRVEGSLNIRSSPEYAIRGHKISYGAITNCYDGWTFELMEQYLLDLFVFGTNTIEISSDANQMSPHFTRRSQAEMIIRVAEIVQSYDMFFSLYASQSDTQWEHLVREIKSLDSFMVPSGDPGDLPADEFMKLVESRAKVVHTYHPECKIWISCQEFNTTELEKLYEILNNERPGWLYGVVYGPHTRELLHVVRERVKFYPIRHYPDVSHGLKCEYPNQRFSFAFAWTEAREAINPRPVQMANIVRKSQENTIGFCAYSEGCNDDINKIIWSALHWDPDTDVNDLMEQYVRYFIGFEHARDIAEAIVDLESNWIGKIPSEDEKTIKTLGKLRVIEDKASVKQKLNWRLQTLLYRGYYDAYIESKLTYEIQSEETALNYFKEAIEGHKTVNEALDASSSELNKNYTNVFWMNKIESYAEQLFQSIRMQLSVVKYRAYSIGRGANLDTIDIPLNNKRFLLSEITRIREMKTKDEQIEALETIVEWKIPPEGGFFDSLGDMDFQEHVVMGEGHWDPSYFHSFLMGYQEPYDISKVPAYPSSWLRYGQTLYDHPLEMYYPNIDKNEKYYLKIVYGGDKMSVPVKLEGNGYEIHPFITKPNPLRILEFDVPEKATEQGQLRLKFSVPKGVGGNGRGNQICEIWLLRGEKQKK